MTLDVLKLTVECRRLVPIHPGNMNTVLTEAHAYFSVVINCSHNIKKERQKARE